jgi:MFS family permease
VAPGTQIGLVGLAGLLGMAGSILIGVYLGAWVGIGGEARSQQSFIWWVVNRLLFLAAVGSIQGFAQYFLADVLHLPNAATMTTLLLAVVALFLLPSALLGGRLSDRVGRKRLVAYAGLIAAAGTFLLLFSRNVPLVIVSGCIIGLGTGTFYAANWALGTDLAPRQEAGRYLGISNLAGAGAGIVGAGIGGPMADFFNAVEPGLGYLVIFAIYAALFLISVATLTRVRLPAPT